MNIVILMLTVLVVGFSAAIGRFIWLNNADARLLELITPIVGALLVSVGWAIKLIYAQPDTDIHRSVGVANIEFAKGGQLAIFDGLKDRSFELADFLLWNRYVNEWNSVFLKKRANDKLESLTNADTIHFEFFEYFVLKNISERFGLGWNHDSKLMIRMPWGSAGTESYGVPTEKIDKVFVKKLMNLETVPNKFISEDDQDEYYQLAIPKGADFEIARTSTSFAIRLNHSRFRMSFSAEMGKSLFDAEALHGTLVYPLFQNLQTRFGWQGSAESTKEIRMRNFTLRMDFEQSRFKRFNEDADLDRVFAENLWKYVADGISWPSVQKWYQEAAFNRLSN